MKVYILTSCDVEGCSIEGIFHDFASANIYKSKLLLKERAEMVEVLEIYKKRGDEYHIKNVERRIKELDDNEEVYGYSYGIGEYEVQ